MKSANRSVPNFRCIGGPRDGERLSVLNLPVGPVTYAPGTGGRVTGRRGEYVTAKRAGERVWVWQEVTGGA